jgi:hypothetical protein
MTRRLRKCLVGKDGADRVSQLAAKKLAARTKTGVEKLQRSLRREQYASGELAACGGYERPEVAERYAFRPGRREQPLIRRIVNALFGRG